MAKKSLIRRAVSVVTSGFRSTEGVPCGYCPIHIFVEHEAGGIIHTKNGKPICARCRVLNGKMGSIIAGDKGKRDADLKAMDNKLQREADEQARVIAEATQRSTGTKKNR